MDYAPEPPDLSFVRTGDGWPFTFWLRDDDTARIRAASGEGERDQCWWDCGDEDGEEPRTWAELLRMPDPRLVQLTELAQMPRQPATIDAPPRSDAGGSAMEGRG